MYSILIKVTTSSAIKWKFLTDDQGVIYTADDLETVQTKVVELLNTYLLSEIKVVKNCIITSSITIEEVESE
jgi:hypothetical protein